MNEFVAKQLVGGMPAVEERLAWAVENFRFRAAQAVGRLRTGKTTLAEFSEWGYENIKDHLYMVAEIGKGERLTRKEIYQVRRILKEQNKYWKNFAQSIANQRQTLKGLEGAELEEAEDKLYAKFGRRAQSYYGAIQAEGRQWYLNSLFPDGTWFRWDMDPLLENCETCIGRDKKVYQKKDSRLPFMPKDGTTICLYNCGCSWTQLVKPPSGRRRKLGPMGARRRGKKLRQKSEKDVFDWGAATLCGICGRALTDPSSVMKGIGPVCEKHMGPGPHPSGSPQSVHAGKRGGEKKLTGQKLSAPSGYIGQAGNEKISDWMNSKTTEVPDWFLNEYASEHGDPHEEYLEWLSTHEPEWGADQPWQIATPDERAQLKAEVAKDLAKTTGVTEQEAADFVKQWAHSSNDDDMRSLAIQRDTAEEFGLEMSDFTKQKIEDRERVLAEQARVAVYNLTSGQVDRRFVPQLSPLPVEERMSLLEAEEHVMDYWGADDSFYSLMDSDKQRKLLRAMYDKTQADLKIRGITEIRLYRGEKISPTQTGPNWGELVGKPISIDTNSIESWSIGSDIAQQFARAEGMKIGVVFETVVPIERILATPATGFGCLTEGEVVVLGGIDGDVANVQGVY